MAERGVIEVGGLSEHPIDAAAYFHDVYVPRVRQQAADGDVVLVFGPADHTHAHWRRGVVRELAREATPSRVNAVVSEDADATALALAYLRSAPGVTGQVFCTDGNSPDNR